MKFFADEEDKKLGKLLPIEYRTQEGVVKQVYVTEKWMRIQKLEKERSKSPDEWIKINFSGPNGDRIEILKIGSEIEASEVSNKRDPETKEMFGFYFSQQGQEVHFVTERWFWEIMKKNMDRLIQESVKNAMDGSGDLAVVNEIEQMFSQEGLERVLTEHLRERGRKAGEHDGARK